MEKRQKLTEGCDKLSRVYAKMFVALHELMQDEDKLRELSPLDYSALGMYIGKFVEQEINSSVVQIMRAFRGVEMPEYYCKYYPYPIKPVITDNNHKIYLNSKNIDGIRTLKTIPLGDSYYALEKLKEEDRYGYFGNYQFLDDSKFLNSWFELFNYRNRMAHIGEIIDIDTLKDNYEAFRRFLNFMPEITKVKKELAPKGYRQSTSSTKKKYKEETLLNAYSYKEERSDLENDKPYKSEKIDIFDSIIKKEIPIIFEDLYNKRITEEDLPEIIKRLFSFQISNLTPFEREMLTDSDLDKYMEKAEKALAKKMSAKVYKERMGLRGLKDYMNQIIVPPNYDDFIFKPNLFGDNKRKSVIAIKKNNYVLVALDGSGKEFTKGTYDDIRLADRKLKNSPYIYRKKGRLPWGFMDEIGKELCGNIIENFECTKNSIMYESNGLRGYWRFAEPSSPFLPPIFDDIQIMKDPREPILFIRNGEEGYVQQSEDRYHFISLRKLDCLDEEKRDEILKRCIREEVE